MRDSIPGCYSFMNTIVDEYISSKVNLNTVIKLLEFIRKYYKSFLTFILKRNLELCKMKIVFLFYFLFPIIFALFHVHLHIKSQKAKQYSIDICIGNILIITDIICMKYSANISMFTFLKYCTNISETYFGISMKISLM